MYLIMYLLEYYRLDFDLEYLLFLLGKRSKASNVTADIFRSTFFLQQSLFNSVRYFAAHSLLYCPFLFIALLKMSTGLKQKRKAASYNYL